MKIPLNKKYKKNQINESKSKYNGNETFCITQSNPNGEILDYAVLYGKKSEKIFLGFKNCLIKEWHYYLIYYYNKNDEITQYIGYKSQISTFKNKIEYLLYDPVQKVFYSKDFKTMIKLELTNYSNLDNISYLNDCSNYLSIPEKFSDNTNGDEFEEDYGKGLNQFVNDFKQYSEKPEDILNILSQKIGVKNLFFCLSFHSNGIELPKINQLILYKKKDSSHFIGIYFDKLYNVFDLEKGKKISIIGWQKLIDFEHKYTYILRFKGSSMKRKDSLSIDDKDILIPGEPTYSKEHI